MPCTARLGLISSSYRFALPSPEAILGLPIGQHISLAAMLPQPDGSHKEIVRSYTPISGDHQPGYFDLLIKSYPTGNISRHMAAMIVGDTLKVKGPKGAMVYTPNMVRCFGMIAGVSRLPLARRLRSDLLLGNRYHAHASNHPSCNQGPCFWGYNQD